MGKLVMRMLRAFPDRTLADELVFTNAMKGQWFSCKTRLGRTGGTGV